MACVRMAMRMTVRMGMAVIVRMVVARMGVGAHEGLFYDTAKAGTLVAMRGSEAVSISSDKKNGSEGPPLQKLEDREKQNPSPCKDDRIRDEGLEDPDCHVVAGLRTGSYSRRTEMRRAGLLGSLTLRPCEAIDGSVNHCEYRMSFLSSRYCGGEAIRSRGIARENVGPSHQIEFLGCARLHANGGSRDVALWREHALSGIGGAGRNAIYFGLRDWFAIAGNAVECAVGRAKSGNAHFSDALSLGSYSGNSIFYAALCGKQCVSFL